MKSTAFLTTFAIILFLKIINGQQNALVYTENFDTNTPVSQHQPMFTYAMVKDLMNQNENCAPNNMNQREILMQANGQPTLPTQQIQLPPDLQQQPLQVQQYLQLQKPQAQEVPPSQQVLQLSPHLQQLLQSQHPLQPQFEIEPPVLSPQIQDRPQLLPQIQNQPTLQSLSHLESIQNLQQPFQHQQSLRTPQPLMIPETLQSPDYNTRAIQPLQQLQFQQNFPQNSVTLGESKNLPDIPVTYKVNTNPSSSQIQVKWTSLNPQPVTNTEYLCNTQNSPLQSIQTSINRPVEMISNLQKPSNPRQEIASQRYYVLSEQPAIPSVSLATAPVVSNSQPVANIPSNYIKSADETYVPGIVPYNLISNSEVKYSVPDTSNPLNLITPTPTIITIPSMPIQGTPHVHYLNQGESTQNPYVHQNLGVRYTEPPQVSVISQPTSLTASQPSILSSLPTSILQTPSVSQYRSSNGYPIGTQFAPVYTRQKSSPNLKSLLPLILQLLKEKIASSACENDCPCECKNESNDNGVNIASGSQKDFGSYEGDVKSVLNPVSDEIDSPECEIEMTKCEQTKKESMETNCETSEEEEEQEESEEVDEEEDC